MPKAIQPSWCPVIWIRHEHEGEVGVAVYYYDIEKNSVEEKVFISTNKSYAQAESELGEMSYYDAKTDMLYTMVDGTLYQYSVEDAEKKALVKGLDAQQYVVSEDGSLIAYQANGDLETATKSDNPECRDRKEAESNLRKRRMHPPTWICQK